MSRIVYKETPIINGIPDTKLKGDEIHIENYLVFTSGALSAYYSMIKSGCPMDDTLYSVMIEGRYVESIFREGELLTVKNKKFEWWKPEMEEKL